MTVIAYDGDYVAADRQTTDVDGTVNECVKLYNVEDEQRIITFAFTGEVRFYKALRDWWLAGAKVDEWPIPKEMKDSFADIIVFSYDKGENVRQLFEYENVPFPIEHDVDSIYAWGSGQQVALGCMLSMRKPNARLAVEVASKVNAYCGGGINMLLPWEATT